MACGVCGDNGVSSNLDAQPDETDKTIAHRQCARSAAALKSDDGNYMHFKIRDTMALLNCFLQKMKLGIVLTA